VPFSVSLFDFLFPICAADALSAARARILSLEAELEASKKDFDAAAAAKTTAEKSTKSTLAKAKKKRRKHLLMLIRVVSRGSKPY
jgi:hypothetical protein